MFGKKKASAQSSSSTEVLIGDQLSFAAAEAYRLLRTNIEFSFPDGDNKKVIGVTSGQSGEGKSTTSLNLAYSMAVAKKNVLLVECDMRLPTLAGRLDIQATPGLSNLLVNKATVAEVLRPSGLSPNLYVINAGDTPPNPSELLSSARMAALIDILSSRFEFIILDLPPVNVVADALIVSKLIDGMVFVVRQDYSTRKSVSDAVRQLEFSNVPLLGFVMTRSGEKGRSYYKYSRNKYGYQDSYTRSYEDAEQKQGKKSKKGH